MAVDWDELEPRKPAARPRDLDSMSIEELTAYIGELEAEIQRARLRIKAKEAHRTGAATLFKKS